MGKIKIASVQFSPEWENPEKNVGKLTALLENADLKGVNLLIFPELTLTGFTMNAKRFAEEIDGITFRFFIELASKYKTDVIGGVMEKDDDKIFNTLLHINKHGLIAARYRKIHPFSYSNENKFFSSGNEPVITEIEKTKVGLTICYDLRFPELYRIYALRGAEVIVNIANWPLPRIKHWDLLLEANAVLSQAYVIGTNRTGFDPFYKYNGHSAIFTPNGERVTQITVEETISISEIDTDEVKRYRNKFPFLNDVKFIKY